MDDAGRHVPPEGMGVRRLIRDKGFDGRPDGVDDGGMQCKHGSVHRSSGVGNARSMSGPSRRPVDPSPSSRAIHPDRAASDDDRVDTVREETPVAKVRRNEPCPCGSAQKAKRCCLSPHRRAAATEARRAFRDLCRDVAPDLDGVDRVEFDELFHEAIHLPELDLSLQVRLPALSSPAIERARAALHDDDTDTFDDALWDVARQLDTPQRRLDLARAIIDYRNAG